MYGTRAWIKYGEGPTKMGTGHLHTATDVDLHLKFEEPLEGTAEDIRYTRCRDNKVLYAVVLGWPGDNETLALRSLSSKNAGLQSLERVELLGSEKGRNLSLQYEQDDSGMHIRMPEKPSDELAYVLRLEFSDEVP